MPKGPLHDLTGLQFNSLTVLRYAGKGRWEVQCECSKVFETRTSLLGKTKNCMTGRCHHLYKHGSACQNPDGRVGTRTYRIWKGLIRRCYSPTCRSYKNYGGRGIKVCKRWREKFEHFLDDMGECPANRTIERINNNGPYSRSNCRWAPRNEQAWNKRNSRLILYRGKRLCLTQWSRLTGIDRATLRKRLNADLPLEKVFHKGWVVYEH